MTSTPARALAAAGLDDEATGAVGAQHLRVVGQAPARVDDDAGRARTVDQTHGEARIVAERGAHAHDDGVGERPAAVQVLEAVGAGDGGGVAGKRGDAAVERLADLGEKVGRAAAVGGQGGVERPGGARLGRPVGARAGAPAPPEGEKRGPDLVGDLRPLHMIAPRFPSPRTVAFGQRG